VLQTGGANTQKFSPFSGTRGRPDASHRTVRPFLRGFRLPCNGAISDHLESITARDLVLVMSYSTRETWTRAPADSPAPNNLLDGAG
jgi:hypothetical protein